MASTKRKQPPARQILFVLGMHRSGTSALGGVLAHLGARAPRSLMAPTKDNPKGYWESVELMKLHDHILASAGSRWNDWSHFNPDWIETPVADEFRASLVPLLQREFGDAPLLLVKDPRISRFFPLWRQALEGTEYTPKVVLPLRHPQAVAESLAVRNHFGRYRSLLLWLRHMLEAEATTRDLKRSLVPYDALLDDWQSQARKVATDLDLRWPAWSGDSEAKIDEFLSGTLRHHVAPAGVTGSEAFVGWADTAYRCLVELAEGKPTAPRFAELDRVRAEFDGTSGIYAAVVREHETRVERLYANVKAQLAEKTQQFGNLTAEHERLQAMLEEARQALSERESALALEQARAADFESRFDRARDKGVEAIAALEARLGSSEAKRERLAAELQAARAESKAELSAHLERLSTGEAERARLAAALEEARLDAQAAAASFEQRMAALEAERDRLAADMAVADVTRQAALVALEARLAGREEEITRLLAELQDAKEAGANEVQALRDQLQVQVEAKAALEARCAEATNQCDELAREAKVAQLGRRRAEASVAERFRETAKLTEMVFKLEQAVVDWEAALTEAGNNSRARERLHREAEQAQARRAALDEFRIQRLSDRASALERQLQAWRATASASRTALEAVRGSKRTRLLGPLLRIPASPAEPLGEDELAQAVSLLRQSELFDPDWYRTTYLASDQEGVDPVVHYLREGAASGFNPGPAFDTVDYLLRYPDVRRNAMNPLAHYLEHGKAEGRSAVAPQDLA